MEVKESSLLVEEALLKLAFIWGGAANNHCTLEDHANPMNYLSSYFFLLQNVKSFTSPSLP